MDHNRSVFGTSPPVPYHGETLARLPEPIIDHSLSFLSIILAALIVLLAVDVTIRLSLWQRVSISKPTHHSLPVSNLAVKAERLLLDFRDLEMQLVTKSVRHDHLKLLLAPEHKGAINLERCRMIDRRLDLNDSRSGSALVVKCSDHSRSSRAFATFCERLLTMNQIWRQEKEIKALRDTLESTQRALRGNAFAAFCDRLLLSNNIWKLEKEVEVLAAGGERMKRARIAGITRLAKRMVLDLRREHLIEELVKDLVDEVEDTKQKITDLRAEHEREIEEMNWEWVKDYSSVIREMGRLRLSLQARLAEQEVANEMEQSLCDSLEARKRKVIALEDKVWEYGKSILSGTPVGPALPRVCESPTASEGGTATDVDELWSDVSISSTCISAGDHERTSAMPVLPRSEGQLCCSAGHWARFPAAHVHHNMKDTSLFKPVLRPRLRVDTNLSASPKVVQPSAIRKRTVSTPTKLPWRV